MPQQAVRRRAPRFWILLAGLVMVLVFLAFYGPFEAYLAEQLPRIRFHNVLFWFASLVAVVGYAIAHWQSFRRNIFGHGDEIDVQRLVFETLQIAVLTGVIFAAGATLQAIEVLAAHLMQRGPIIDPAFGEKVLAIILLVILAILFYLLHHVVRAFREGWHPRRPPPRVAAAGNRR